MAYFPAFSLCVIMRVYALLLRFFIKAGGQRNRSRLDQLRHLGNRPASERILRVTHSRESALNVRRHAGLGIAVLLAGFAPPWYPNPNKQRAVTAKPRRGYGEPVAHLRCC